MGVPWLRCPKQAIFDLTHLALNVSGYVYLVSNGEIVYQSTPEELKNSKEIQVKYLAVEV